MMDLKFKMDLIKIISKMIGNPEEFKNDIQVLSAVKTDKGLNLNLFVSEKLQSLVGGFGINVQGTVEKQKEKDCRCSGVPGGCTCKARITAGK